MKWVIFGATIIAVVIFTVKITGQIATLAFPQSGRPWRKSERRKGRRGGLREKV